MKLKKYNRGLNPKLQGQLPCVTVNHRGCFSFHGAAVVLIGASLPDNRYIEVLQDEENPKDWYVTMVPDATGFELTKLKKGQGLKFSCAPLAKDLLRTMPKTPSATSPLSATLKLSEIPVDHEGQTLFKIIIKS